MSDPSISCVIAVYNGADYLAQAVDSVLAQTVGRVQIVVVDDGSTDGTDAVIRSYGDRIETRRQANQGVSVARNQGAAFSDGELLCFLDADDRLHPDKLQRQLEAYAQRPELELCDCYSEYFWSEEMTPEQLDGELRYHQPFWKERLPGHISTWLLRRGLFERVGGFKPGMRYAEDMDWIARAADCGAATHRLDAVLTYRRLHPHNVTGSHRKEQLEGLADMMKAHLDRVRSNA